MKNYTSIIAELEAQLKIARLEKELADLKAAAAQKQPTKKSTPADDLDTHAVCMAVLPTQAEPAQAQAVPTPELDVLRSVGAAYFASHAYDELIGGSNAWKTAGSQTWRAKTYSRLDRAGKIRAAALVAEMNQKRLNSNTIGLTGAEVATLAEAVAKLQ